MDLHTKKKQFNTKPKKHPYDDLWKKKKNNGGEVEGLMLVVGEFV